MLDNEGNVYIKNEPWGKFTAHEILPTYLNWNNIFSAFHHNNYK